MGWAVFGLCIGLFWVVFGLCRSSCGLCWACVNAGLDCSGVVLELCFGRVWAVSELFWAMVGLNCAVVCAVCGLCLGCVWAVSKQVRLCVDCVLGFGLCLGCERTVLGCV